MPRIAILSPGETRVAGGRKEYIHRWPGAIVVTDQVVLET
jgi:hypothetical protein